MGIRGTRGDGTPGTAILGLVAIVSMAVVLGAWAAPAEARRGGPRVTGLSHHVEPIWGGDWITVTGSGFHRRGRHAVAKVSFGRDRATHFYVVDDHTLEAMDPEVGSHRRVHVVVTWKNGARSATNRSSRFRYITPNTHTPIHNGWSTVQSRAIGTKVIRRVSRTKAPPLAPRRRHWTKAMGASALARAKRWVGMPYTWGGGNAHGPTYGSRYGNGLLGHYNAMYRGFDCSGLTLYAWWPYTHLSHYSAAQPSAGRFRPSVDELQPGDLLFYSGGGSTISHVVMYAGRGRIIQAPWSGHPVAVNRLTSMHLHEPRFFGATRPMSRGKQGAGPSITGLSASGSSPSGGTTVTISGTQLSTTSRIRFGTTATYDFTIVSATKVRVRVPAHSRGHVNVRIGNAWGISAKSAATRFAYAK